MKAAFLAGLMAVAFVSAANAEGTAAPPAAPHADPMKTETAPAATTAKAGKHAKKDMKGKKTEASKEAEGTKSTH